MNAIYLNTALATRLPVPQISFTEMAEIAQRIRVIVPKDTVTLIWLSAKSSSTIVMVSSAAVIAVSPTHIMGIYWEPESGLTSWRFAINGFEACELVSIIKRKLRHVLPKFLSWKLIFAFV